jgi:Spy/CpxP family protein refolding chaperone
MRLSSNPIFLAVCGCVAIMLLASAANAQKPPEPAEFGAGQPAQQQPEQQPYPFGLAEGRLMTEIAEDLGLTDATLDAIKALTETERAEEKEALEAYVAKWAELNELLNEAIPSEEALAEASRAVGDAAIKMRNLKLTYTRKVRALLPAETLESFMLRRKSVPMPRAGARRR